MHELRARSPVNALDLIRAPTAPVQHACELGLPSLNQRQAPVRGRPKEERIRPLVPRGPVGISWAIPRLEPGDVSWDHHHAERGSGDGNGSAEPWP